MVPLITHLRAAGIKRFAEPCCGEGDLVRHLESFGLHCAYAGDIATGQDALAIDSFGGVPPITNPPYDTVNRRKLMHELILHFMRAAPFAWLLIDYDWSATRQAAPFLRHCTDIVIIPRQKWIEGSKNTGKDNHAWYRFDINHTAGPVLHNNRGQGEAIPRRTRVCEQCGKRYEPQRWFRSRYCSQVCKQQAYRKRLSVTPSVTPTPNTSIEPSDSPKMFRYIRHADVPRFTAEGWELLPALDGTHHGEYSVLMRRREQG